jgi:hypothetical protein
VDSCFCNDKDEVVTIYLGVEYCICVFFNKYFLLHGESFMSFCGTLRSLCLHVCHFIARRDHEVLFFLDPEVYNLARP